MSFESELSFGNFCIPKCTKCKKIVWPPSEYCDNCYETVSLEKGDFEGKIVEYSKDAEGYFCMVEFVNSIRIMARKKEEPEISQIVKISKCGINNKNYFFEII
jgi:uncharacterized OB-fold protein